jgi:hypothetical protein
MPYFKISKYMTFSISEPQDKLHFNLKGKKYVDALLVIFLESIANQKKKLNLQVNS